MYTGVYCCCSVADQEKSVARRKRQQVRRELGDDAPPVQQPHTIESLRVPDATTIVADDAETEQVDRQDEFSGYFDGQLPPKVLLSAGDFPSPVGF